MATGRESGAAGGSERTYELSTWHTVALPVAAEATMLGAVFSAPAAQLADLLPDGLSPLPVTRSGTGAVTFLSVEYHRMGVEGLDPYDEFVVMIPSTHDLGAIVPYATALRHATNGYVWYMPVATEPARALGVDVWGYPKVVADITHEDHGSGRKTTVTVEGDHFVTFEMPRPPAASLAVDGFSYAVRDGTLLRVPTEVDGDLGFWPLSDAVSVTLGDHPDADPLRALDLGDRALARLSVKGDVAFFDGEPV